MPIEYRRARGVSLAQAIKWAAAFTEIAPNVTEATLIGYAGRV